MSTRKIDQETIAKIKSLRSQGYSLPEINLQLLPENRKKIELHARGENVYFIGAIILVVLVGGLYLATSFYHSSVIASIQSVDSDLTTLEQQRDKATEEKLLIGFDK